MDNKIMADMENLRQEILGLKEEVFRQTMIDTTDIIILRFSNVEIVYTQRTDASKQYKMFR